MAACLLGLLAVVPSAGSDGDQYRRLVWHAELVDGTEVSSRKPDVAMNPASVVKVATTLWALQELGPWHRFDAGGAIDEDRGAIEGDLHVVGGGDPDFHRENAVLVARLLNERGVREIRGDLLVDDRFWIGWEDGSSHRATDPKVRARVMAARLRSALDCHRWDGATRRAWERVARRRGWSVRPYPRVLLRGSYLPAGDATPEGSTLVTHRSKPVLDVLRRFNAYSNNDIERFGELLGGAGRLARLTNLRWGLPEGTVQFETTSGLGVNRATARQVVRLLRELMLTCRHLDLELSAVLPVAGCDPGTLRSFVRLGDEPYAGSVTGKTGTLIYTDGGVSVFAGVARTASGDVLFCVAMPRSGRKMHWARRQEESWLLELIEGQGGPRAAACPGPLPMPDVGAEVFAAHAVPRPLSYVGVSTVPRLSPATTSRRAP